MYKGNLENVINPLPTGTFPENSVLYECSILEIKSSL